MKAAGGGDGELIRLEEQAGLDTILMSTAEDSGCVSGGFQRDFTPDV